MLSIEQLWVERRYRCIDTRHEPLTYNPLCDKTWCRCGQVVRPGNHASYLSPYERAEVDQVRLDKVGRQAREFLTAVHSGSKSSR